ncbi:MAG TPA: hypothetical protein VEW91_00480, partial [bacterium]|nr:hypothetical protein [bacterium]
YHAFDQTEQVQRAPDAISGRLCTWVEVADGQFAEKSGREFSTEDPCISRGMTFGGNDRARRQAVEDVTAFLRQLFKLGQ